MNRRNILKLITANTLTLPFLLQASPLPTQKRHLILIELKGGNDGLNTIVPYTDPNYYKLRPNIAIRKNEIIAIDDQFGLHPAMDALKPLFDKKEIAIIHGVGYPHPNLSHFRSIDIWNTASDADIFLEDGWLTTLRAINNSMLNAAVLGGDYGPLLGDIGGTVRIQNIRKFLRQSRQVKGRIFPVGENLTLIHLLQTERQISQNASILRKHISQDSTLPFAFTKSFFGRQMESVAKLIIYDTHIPYFKVSIGSFDTHYNQLKKHAKLLKDFSDNIQSLRQNLMAKNRWDNTLMMTYSEFGRRAAENASRGTDHGTAAPHFLIGGKVKGGLYGEHPSLRNLDKDGNLIYTTDFRSVYNTVAKKWLNTSSPLFESFSTFAPFQY